MIAARTLVGCVGDAIANDAMSAARLFLSRITLTDFRSYAALRLDLDGRPVVLTGSNGAGKTNLLEAVSYLSPGRGLRGARLSEVARLGDGGSSAPSWAVAGTLETENGACKLGAGWIAAGPSARERRIVRIDGEPAAGPAALARHVAVVWLVPAMDRLLSGAPADRRRFLDRLVYAVDPDHAARVQKYDHARRERARLLRDGAADAAWLASLERGIAEQAVAIAAARLDFADRLAAHLHDDVGPFPAVTMALEGFVEDRLRSMPALAVEDALRERLEEGRAADRESGSCEGPHRSDLQLTLVATGRPAALCSTGEQKAMLIGLILAHARLLTRVTGQAPILLLDEIAAHLDEARRAALFDMIVALRAQAWLTGTEPGAFAPLGARAQFLTVRPGSVTEEVARG